MSLISLALAGILITTVVVWLRSGFANAATLVGLVTGVVTFPMAVLALLTASRRPQQDVDGASARDRRDPGPDQTLARNPTGTRAATSLDRPLKRVLRVAAMAAFIALIVAMFRSGASGGGPWVPVH